MNDSIDQRTEARIRLGEHLSQARQSKEISIGEASDRLRIRKVYLEALESGDWTGLPEEVYVMGFLRQYSALLGVDLSEQIEDLKTGEYRLTKPFTMPDPPIAMNRTWAIAAGACFVVLLILFNVIDEGEKELHPVQQVITPAVQPDTPAIAEQEATAESSIEPGATESPADTPVEDAGQDMEVVSDAVETIAESVTPQPPTTPDPAVSTLPEVAAQDSEPALSMPQAGERHAFHLTAVGEDVWLQLYNPDGSLAKEALLRKDQTLRLNTDVDYLMLTSGNPLALSISIDGLRVAEAGTLGEKNKVLRDYRLLPPAAPSDSGN